ncbi:dTDP-4-amino-4,6-dideoxygalactose transaminase [Lachnospiraceae bacterium KH1T2]|nr:dTDP-4-amino-4,6-dideoxygalactose transaminase [Lachnospiraceae bacterium KH1T2]
MPDEKVLVTRSSMPSYEEYIEAIKPLWDTHWLTNMGKYHKDLESKLKSFLDVPELSLTVNGHMALELAIQAFNFPEGSEVITTPFTFISTTHAIVRNRLKPVFCDVKESDGTIDESKIEELITEKTVAIIPVHVYGHVCSVEAIEQIAYKYNLKVIYDAAHAFGVSYKGKGIANYGDAAIFSFHATKVFNTIEGGAIGFKEHSLYEKIFNLKNFGIRGEELVVEVGANAKMNEFCAIMGLCNLKHLPDAINDRKRICDRYDENLKAIKGIRLLKGSASASRNYAYYPILITDEYYTSRNEVYEMLKANNIFLRKYFYPLTSDQACFKNKYKHLELNIAKRLSSQILVLPLYEGLEDEKIDMITNLLHH